MLTAEILKHHVDTFNADDQELYTQYVPNSRSLEFLRDNIPLLECPDKEIEKIYYFRWWTFRKHLKETPDGFVFTEFLAPVRHAGVHNTISCALGHHIREGRWMRDQSYIDQYVRFWFRGAAGKPQSHFHQFSSWLADALLNRCRATGEEGFALDLLNDMIDDFSRWEQERGLTDGMFWQRDVSDGMEESISGSRTAKNIRPTINSYMFANARAIAEFALIAGRKDVAAKFQDEAKKLKKLVQSRLWDERAEFFKTFLETGALADVREEIGFTPWYVNLPDEGYEQAWRQLMDEEGFKAPFGPTTAERRHPRFTIAYTGDDCQWNGPSWPFATSVTLTAMANLLQNYRQTVVTAADYFDVLTTYTRSHRLTRDDGKVVPWIDENLHPFTGMWLARERKKARPQKFCERGKDYNHSTYCDLIITGLAGLKPRADDIVEINPLIPAGWDWFCLDELPYHKHSLTIVWDRTGAKYNRGAGLAIFADGKELTRRADLGCLLAPLPPK